MATRGQVKQARHEAHERKLYGTGAVRYTLPKGFNGPINLNVDFGLAAPPESYYYASTVSVQRDQALAMVGLYFGRVGAKERPGSSVNVVLPERAVFDIFWNSTRGVEQVLDQQLQSLGRPVPEIGTAPQFAFAKTLYANSVFLALGLGESCLDFYYLPPKDVHLARTRGADVELYPIIRIILSNLLLKRCLNLCRPYAIPAETPRLVNEAVPDMRRKAKRAKSR